MNGNNKIILTISATVLSLMLLGVWSQPALAKGRGKNRPATGRNIREKSNRSRRSGKSGAKPIRQIVKDLRDDRKGKDKPLVLGHGRRKSRRDSHDSHRSDRHSRDHGDRSRFGIGFGFSTYDYYPGHSYRRWVPGYYQTRTEEVLVEPGHYEWQSRRIQVEPGRYEILQVPAVEEIRYDADGEAYKVVIEPERTETIWIEPKYEEHKVKVWVPDRYETRQISMWVPGYWVDSYYRSSWPSRLWFGIGGRFRF